MEDEPTKASTSLRCSFFATCIASLIEPHSWLTTCRLPPAPPGEPGPAVSRICSFCDALIGGDMSGSAPSRTGECKDGLYDDRGDEDAEDGMEPLAVRWRARSMTRDVRDERCEAYEERSCLCRKM